MDAASIGCSTEIIANTHKNDLKIVDVELKLAKAADDGSIPSAAIVSSSVNLPPVVDLPITAAGVQTSKPATAAGTTQAQGQVQPQAKPIANKLNDPSLKQIPTEELLGSVTTFYPSGDAECGHALRTSARVIHKMRMDSIRGNTPPPQDRKEGGTGVAAGKAGSMGSAGSQVKTPNQQKAVRVVWSNQDKNLFFEALNECGKDFEGIANYLNTKKRRKDSNSELFKVKDVRHLYYQFNQKVSKYLHFSDDVKKEAQELYALINYGEMRKKVPFQNKKYFHKLKDLVYRGSTTIREKGRNIRIKTPSCRALRKLNQLEEWQEEIKLPPRVDVILRPATVEAWGRVQSLAQNPRIKTTVTLQKRLSTLLQMLQQKWRHQDVRLVERISNLKNLSVNVTSKASRQKMQHELELCSRFTTSDDDDDQKILRFTPPKTAVIHRPMINLTEFLSSYSICLNSYEQRIGAKVRGEALCVEKLNSFKDRLGANSKRQRHDSGSEKHSPDGKKVKPELKDGKEEKIFDGNAVSNLAEVFKSPNASNESIDILKDIENSDNECHLPAKSFTVSGCDDPEVKGGSESNDSLKLSGLSKLKFELEAGGIGGDNSNDGATSENEQQQAKTQKVDEGGDVSASDDLIKTTVKRKESREKCGKRKDSKSALSGLSSLHFRPLISEEAIQKIREGWTVQSVGDLTVGDLYIMFGEENRLHLEYAWVASKDEKSDSVVHGEEVCTVECSDVEGNERVTSSSTNGSLQMVGLNGGGETIDEICNEINLSGRLRQLLQIASLNEKTGKRRCPCGHVCDRRNKNTEPSASAMSDSLIFKQPMAPLRNSNVASLAGVQNNILSSPHMRYKNSRWWRTRVNRHQLPSQRSSLLPNGSAGYAPGRNNNNNYTSSAKVTTAGIGQQVLSSQGVGAARNGTTIRSAETEDSLTKLLEDKISSISSTGKASSSASKSVGAVAADTNDDGSCISLFDISLPSTSSTLIADLMGTEAASEISNCTTISATKILQELPADGKLPQTDINDISLSSFLGHLDAVYDNEPTHRKKDTDQQMNISIISESSVDYIARFEDIAAELRAQNGQPDSA
ncbi:protein cramped [Toxorhynchites rutilus septentrionalis]|uniref:protein cramped n=1 Tax=Toxorhynchites rutilus septentrionalis TaxID=329112 RepID=UPI0024791388|nr:protein cramped [Toxorhynchites rutilus septentrionalis]